MGDHNINRLNVDSRAPTSQFINNMYIHSLIPFITKPARITKHDATLIMLIDNIYTNNLAVNNRQTQGILVTDISDHLRVFHIVYNYNKTDNAKDKYITKRLIIAERIISFKRIYHQPKLG